MAEATNTLLLNLQEVAKLPSLDLIARHIVEGTLTGLHKSPYHGFSVEFAEHRPYNTGESIRNLDWKVFAKTEKLFVKKFEEETNLRCCVLLDISRSMRYPEKSLSKLEYGIYLSASLMYLLQTQRDAVGLSLFDEEIRFHSGVKSSSVHLHHLLRKLDALRKENADENVSPPTSVASVLHRLSDKIHRRSMVVIISDMFDNVQQTDEIISALRHLRHDNHEVLIFHVLDRRTEEAFEFSVGPAVFEDLETGEKLKIETTEVKEIYKQRMKNFKELLKRKCGEFRIDFNEIDIETPFDKALLKFLVKRNTLL